MENRLSQFEAMLEAVQKQYADTTQKMDALRQSGKEKSATFRQLMGDKLMYQSFLSMYNVYGLLDDNSKNSL